MTWSGHSAHPCRGTPASSVEEKGKSLWTFTSLGRELPKPFNLSGNISFPRCPALAMGSDNNFLKVQFRRSFCIFSQQNHTMFKQRKCKTLILLENSPCCLCICHEHSITKEHLFYSMLSLSKKRIFFFLLAKEAGILEL